MWKTNHVGNWYHAFVVPDSIDEPSPKKCVFCGRSNRNGKIELEFWKQNLQCSILGWGGLQAVYYQFTWRGIFLESLFLM